MTTGSARRALRHDPARRRAGAGPLVLRRRPHADPPQARPARPALHRRGVAGRQPPRHGVLPPGDQGEARPRRARRLRDDPTGGGEGRGQRDPPRPPRRRDRDGVLRRQELGRPRREGAADRSGRGRGDGPRHREAPAWPGPPGVLRRRALLRRLPRERRLRGPRAGGRRRGGRRAPRALRHERRHASLGGRPDRGGGRRTSERRGPRDPHAQRHRMRGRLRTRGRRGRRAAGPGGRERLRRADRQRRHRADRGQPDPEDGRRLPAGGRRRASHRARALRRRGGQRRPRLPPAVRGPLRLHAQGRAARERCRPVQRGLRARRRRMPSATGAAWSPPTSAAPRP